MKKTWLGLLSALVVSTALGGVATINASAAVEDVPETLTTENVALGKEATFRSLTDMSVEIKGGSYWPDSQGFYDDLGGGMFTLTDGNATWESAQSRSPQTRDTHAWAFIDLGKEIAIDNIKVGYLAAWCFTDVVIQVSNDPTFTEGVTTVFAVTDTVYADDGTTVIYNGGQVGCSVETKAQTGWNGQIGVDSVTSGLLTYAANGVSARYVRLTNSDGGNNGAFNVTTFTEIQVYAVKSGVKAPKASVASGSYAEMTTVALTAAYSDAEIYYTLDGSYPTKNSTKYEGPIDASEWTGAVALRAVTVVDGKQSEAVDYIYKITVPSENVALGKEATFRSLTDMSVEIKGGSYWPDSQGFYDDLGGGMFTLTDGNATWESAQSRSPQTRDTHAWAFIDLGKEIAIDNIKVGYLAAWCFTDVVIQVSNDPTFTEGVTTVFAVTDTVYADDGTTVIYNGGQVGCSVETKAQTGWNGQIGVDSVTSGLLTYAANGVSARYVRLTNSDGGNNGAFNVTTFTEIQVWSQGGANFADPELKDTVKSVATIENALEVVPGTTLEGVKALLPATVGYTTMAGATGEIALTWESADWAEMTQGTFTFTANPVVALDDVFEIIPASYTFTVTVNKADTTAIDALIAEVEALNGATYTVKTWTPLATLVAEAKEAIALVTVTEATIANYIDSITTAKAALKQLATDKTELATAVTTASAINKANYMSATVVGLDEALATATAVNNDTDASVEEATAALNGLNTVLNGLVEKGDTTALAALVAEIKAANLVEENYTELTWATLEDKLAAAEAIVEATETPKTEVDAAYTALENAKNGLVAYGDNTELAALVVECNALAQADYTVNSWTAFNTELTEATALLTQKVMQDVLDAAKAELQTAKEGLISVVALKAAIASTINEADYTAISVQLWKDAKTAAQLVLDNPAATAQEIADAVTAIETAQGALVEKPADNSSNSADNSTDNSANNSTEDKESSKGNQNGLGMLSCGGVIDAASASLMMAGVAIVALLRKKKD